MTVNTQNEPRVYYSIRKNGSAQKRGGEPKKTGVSQWDKEANTKSSQWSKLEQNIYSSIEL